MNWNGMIGQLAVVARPATYIERIQLFPDIDKKEVGVKVWLKNVLGK